MQTPIKYGKQVTISTVGTVMSTQEEVFANYQTVKTFTVMSEIVRVKDDKDILAEFLKLLDRQKAGEIDQISLRCIRNAETGSMRVEKQWLAIKQ